MLGSSYPLLNTFWTILYFFLFFLPFGCIILFE